MMRTTPFFPRIALIAALSAALFLATGSGVVSADVSFVHDYSSDDMLLGTKSAELVLSYSGADLFVDKQTRFNGTWMKRFFGKVQEERVSTEFLLDRGQIREIDWQNRRIYVYDLNNLDKIEWIQRRKESYEGIDEHLKARYDIKKPKLDITIDPDTQNVAGYACRHVTAHLRLETVDRHKQSSSVTLIKQDLWLTRNIPGYQLFEAFHQRLAQHLGIEAERLGPLTFLLRYWDGPLDPISSSLEKVSGYTVKTDMTAIAEYHTHINSDSPKTIRKVLKQESMTLSRISEDAVSTDPFKASQQFEIIFPE